MQKSKTLGVLIQLLAVVVAFAITVKYTWLSLESSELAFSWLFELRLALIFAIPLLLVAVGLGILFPKRGWIFGFIIALVSIFSFIVFFLCGFIDSIMSSTLCEPWKFFLWSILIILEGSLGGYLGQLMRINGKEPFDRALRWITEEITIVQAILAFLIAFLILTALGYGIGYVQYKFFYPRHLLPSNPLLDMKLVKFILYYNSFAAKGKALIMTIITILFAVALIHRSFVFKREAKKLMRLLSSSLFFSIIGFPFLFFLVSQSIMTEEAYNIYYKSYTFFSVCFANFGVIPFSLYIFRNFAGYFTDSPFGFVSTLYFGAICFCYSSIIARIYQSTFSRAFIRYFLVMILLGIFWLAIYRFLPQFDFGEYGTKIGLFQKQIDFLFLR